MEQQTDQSDYQYRAPYVMPGVTSRNLDPLYNSFAVQGSLPAANDDSSRRSNWLWLNPLNLLPQLRFGARILG